MELCMKPNEYIKIAETPDPSKKFRMNTLAPVGKAGRHYAFADDTNYPPSGDGVIFGKKSERGSKVLQQYFLLVEIFLFMVAKRLRM